MATYFGSNLILLEKLATGGMGEVYWAKQIGTGGFEKSVAVKRILPHYAARKEFEEMFRNEMNLCARLQHPNIAQVFSNGQEAGYLYLLMEFVEGKNLAELLSKARHGDLRIPVEVACCIIAEAAKGLDYAHKLKDSATGESLNIIHRDISPQNIMVSYDGQVKLVDFGIAKAADSADLTKLGDLKGKVPYVSPEQIDGKKLDGRSDIFSLGVVFYELLSLRSLFAGESTFETIKNVRERPIESIRTHNSEVPPELEAIILRALERDRIDRYGSAEEFYRDLVMFMNRAFPKFVSTDLATFMRKIFHDKMDREQQGRREISNQVREEVRTSNDSGKTPAGRSSGASLPANLVRDSQANLPAGLSTRLNSVSEVFWRRKYSFMSALVVINCILIWILTHIHRVGPPLEPSRVSGMISWYDAQILLHGVGRGLSEWDDVSPLRNHLIQTDPNRMPTVVSGSLNGHPVVHFDGVDDYLTSDSLAKMVQGFNATSFFMVARASGDRTHYVFALQAKDRDTDIIRFGFTQGYRLRVKASRDPGTNYLDSEELVTSDRFAIYVVVFRARDVRVYRNGKLIINRSFDQPVSYHDAGAFSVGQEYDMGQPSDFFFGDLAEVGSYAVALSDGDREGIENYLAKKYAIGLDR